MLFPESQRTVFARNPLTEVICQLRFPPILQITAEEPVVFQNQVRYEYPQYEREGPLAGVPEEVKGLLSGLPLQLPGVIPGAHRFKTEDRTREIALAQEFVAVTERNYTRWEQFRQAIELATRTTEDVYRPAFYSRVGLRYQNTINRSGLGLHNVGWDELLTKPFAGILSVPELRNNIREKRVQFLMELDEPDGSYLTIRHGLQPAESGEELHYVIDADFFTTTKRSRDDALTILDHFHRDAGNFFRWAISRRLFDALGPEPLD